MQITEYLFAIKIHFLLAGAVCNFITKLFLLRLGIGDELSKVKNGRLEKKVVLHLKMGT